MKCSASFCLTFLIFLGFFARSFQSNNFGKERSSFNQNAIFYTPAVLRSLRSLPSQADCVNYDLPPEIKPRKRGRKGGVRARFRRRSYRPPLPAIVTGNVRSINNKIEELCSNCRFYFNYREAGLICLSETWLKECTTDTAVDIDNYTLYRCDRNENSGKTTGGGVCVYVNNRWCTANNTHVTQRICTLDFELLSLSLRPKYLPREFPKVDLNVVYIATDANRKRATEDIITIINDQQAKSPDSVVIITGDFNHRTLDRDLPNFHQYINCPTRNDNTLDLCYVNVNNAYQSRALPPLGESDHNMVLLTPTYKSKLKQVKPVKKTVNVWNDDNLETLRACFDCTDWDMFTTECKEINELNDTISGYITFCEGLFVQQKEIVLYGNCKPWVNKELKQALDIKQKAFIRKDNEAMKEACCAVKSVVKKCKKAYASKVEEQIKTSPKAAWDGLKLMSGCTNKKTNVEIDGDNIEYVNELNTFYARFDVDDSDMEERRNRVKRDLIEGNESEFLVSKEEVEQTFRSIKARKANGPDGMKGLIFKHCSCQLSYIYSVLFNMSLQTYSLPLMWKTSKIIPIPKKTHVSELNDLRPVALTSIVIKCFEKIIMREISRCMFLVQDQMQFAYRAQRSVEDALLIFLQNIYKHIDTPKNYCRLLFIDFSSAFNTIQPLLLVSKLQEINVNKHVIAWVLDFLSYRPQYVQLNNHRSNTITTNIGAPQGTVLSPLLFTIYTNNCQSNYQNIHLIKFADDTVIQGLLSKDENNYLDTINWFVSWCKDHSLQLNIKKTKEMIIDFRRKHEPLSPIWIDGEEVERVTSYKYLGVTIDDKLNWEHHTDILMKKLNTRLYFLRKLKTFHVDTTLLSIFYKSILQSAITFSIVVWGGNISINITSKINRIIKRGRKLCNHDNNIHDFEDLYICHCQKKILSIITDPSHPLFHLIKYSNRSGRIQLSICKSERYRRSFLPSAIKLL